MSYGKVSIIMAAFNADSFIDGAINSVINQSYIDWELVIVNDGSIDQTENKILLFKDERIVYYKIENAGVSAARNFGLTKMTGEYYTYFDADDLLTPDSILSRIKIFNEQEATCFVDGNVQVYDKHFKKLLYKWRPKRNGQILKYLINLSGDCFFGPTWLIHRDKTSMVFFNESLTHGEDLLQFIELAAQGGNYRFTDEVVLKYRKHGTSAMNNLNGLKDGYLKIYRYLVGKEIISGSQKTVFRKKVFVIMMKSYLRRLGLRDLIKFLKDYYRM